MSTDTSPWNNVQNVPARGVPYFTPGQWPPSGTAYDPQPDGQPLPILFTPLKIRGVEFQNRIFVSPLCQYSADDGHVTMWHHAHLGGIFTRGPGLTVIEATAVTPEGRITPQDAGIWSDSHVPPLKAIVDFAHAQGQKIGIQLAHAGRKASTLAPWLHGGLVANEKAGGWPDDVWAPSPIPWAELFPVPKELTTAGIKRVVVAYVDAARRAVAAGFDVIEIHSAHGYLMTSFLSPATNKRTDEYGGSFENRTRLTLEVVDAVRAVIPPDMPLFLRISATEWLEEALPSEPSWTVADTVRLAPILAAHGVDLLDISSGGNHSQQRIKSAPGHQSVFSEAVRKAVGGKAHVGAVGGIESGKLAENILQEGRADVIFVGRGFQKNPGLVWAFADELGVAIKAAHQIEWGFRGRPSVKAAKNEKGPGW